MNAYANENLRMPTHYTDMSEKEMEYDGTGFFKVFSQVFRSSLCVAGMSSGAAVVVGGCIIAAGAGWTGAGLFVGAGTSFFGACLIGYSAQSLVDIWKE